MLRKANNCALMGVMLATFMLVVSPKLVASELGDSYISPDNTINIKVDYNEDNNSVVIVGQMGESEEVGLAIQENTVLDDTKGAWEEYMLLLEVNEIKYEIGIAETGALFCNIK